MGMIGCCIEGLMTFKERLTEVSLRPAAVLRIEAVGEGPRQFEAFRIAEYEMDGDSRRLAVELLVEFMPNANGGVCLPFSYRTRKPATSLSVFSSDAEECRESLQADLTAFLNGWEPWLAQRAELRVRTTVA
jgi:hypothetical protein